MKQGIHLGPPLGRLATAFKVTLALLLVLTALNFFDTWRMRRQVVALRQALSGEGETGASPTVLSAGSRETLQRIQAVAASGVLETHAPTALLSLLEATLPPGLTLTAVTLRPGPPTSSVLVEAIADAESDLTAFQKALVASPLVADTALLEERRTAANQLVVRLEASLEAP